MYVLFFVVIFLIILIALPLYLKIELYANLARKRAYICIYLFSLQIKHLVITIKNNELVLVNFKSCKEKTLKVNKKNVAFAKSLQKEIFARLYLESCIANFDIGIKNNVIVTTFIFALLKISLNCFYGYISTQKPTSKLFYNLNTYLEKNVGIIKLKLKVWISIFNLLTSLKKAKRSING